MKSYKSVWDAIEDSPQAAANMKARAALLRAVQEQVQMSGKTQTAAARWLGITQPRLSDLMRGHIDRFSLDALVNMLGTIGADVQFRVRQRKAA